MHGKREAMQDKKLYAFDVLLIIGAGRFTEFDISLAIAAKEHNVDLSPSPIPSHIPFPCPSPLDALPGPRRLRPLQGGRGHRQPGGPRGQGPRRRPPPGILPSPLRSGPPTPPAHLPFLPAPGRDQGAHPRGPPQGAQGPPGLRRERPRALGFPASFLTPKQAVGEAGLWVGGKRAEAEYGLDERALMEWVTEAAVGERKAKK